MKNTLNILLLFVCAILLNHVISFEANLHTNEWPSTERSYFDCGRVPVNRRLLQDSAVSAGISQTGLGRDQSGLGRILNGNDAELGEWPWIVQLVTVIQDEVPNNCSGSLINSRWILTAGHCAERVSEPKYWKATFGLYDVDEPNYISTDILIDDIILHPNYKNLNNDVALFHLSEPIEFNDYIQPVCLIEPDQDVVSYTHDKDCFTIGYGYTIGMRPASKLQKLKVTTYPDAYCLLNWTGKKRRVKEGAVCVGPNNEELNGASCRGDSGGPNVCFNEQTDRWEQFGIVSYGPSQCDRDEGDKWLTAAADLTNYVDWIQATTGIK